MAKRGSSEWREKIARTKDKFRVKFNCDYCGKDSEERQSHFKRKKRHFCQKSCYSKFRAELLPKEEQNSYGSGNSPEERKLRARVRSITNHAIRDGKIKRKPCEVCANKAEAHHPDYSKPLKVKWLCLKHHREEHKRIHEHPNLLTTLYKGEVRE